VGTLPTHSLRPEPRGQHQLLVIVAPSSKESLETESDLTAVRNTVTSLRLFAGQTLALAAAILHNREIGAPSLVGYDH
jgi:hypothetical protein